MNPSAAQPIPPQPPIPRPKPKRIILITVITIIIIILAAALIYSQNLFKNKPVQDIEQTQKPPAPTTIPVPDIKLQTSRGIITKLISNSLTIKTGTNSATFDISKTKDFQKIISGTLAGGDAKTATASAKELKTGQEVLVMTLNKNIEAAEVAAVFIIK